MKIDQAALTGESLPVTRGPGDIVLSGTTVKQGEIEAMVQATGVNTVAGKSEFLVATTNAIGHLQTVLTQIGAFCCGWILIWIVVLCIVLYGGYNFDYRRGIDMILVILIGGVPIAMPTVLSVTMAIGVNELAKEHAVVTRITAVEELAGMDILCSDKTGTLTLNRLTVMDPAVNEPFMAEDVLLIAALASRRQGDPDAVDRCINECVPKDLEDEINARYDVQKFVPFDPVSKRTEAHILDKKTGKTFLASKGAPQVIINLAYNADEIRDEQNRIIEEYATRGLRALGVTSSDDGGANWHFMGLLSLSDPPRPDTKETIQAAVALGVRVVMITGDQVAIGRETARVLGMGLNFHAAHVLKEQFIDGIPIAQIIEDSQGWGEVMPEDKYKVVQALRANGHLVGMTGDGVNDAPALKAADVGIAVADATDAARGAADMVLLTEGLSVIIMAILGSRCIFQRMRNYATYACATTIRIVTTFSLLACIWEFTYPPFLVLIIALLNDGTIMTVSTDRVEPSTNPDSWRLRDIFIMAFVLGFYLTLSSLIFFYLIIQTEFFENTFGATPIKYNTTHPSDPQSFMLCGIMYLQVSITGQLIIFSTRARTFFFRNRPSVLLMCAAVIAQVTATLIAVYGNASWTQLYPIGWGWAAIVWVWSIIWILPIDFPKMFCNILLERGFWKFFQFRTVVDIFQLTFNSKGLGLANKEGARGRTTSSGPPSVAGANRNSLKQKT
jgi:H+-transporting ATPase